MRNFLTQLMAFLLPILFLGAIAEFLLRRMPNDFKIKKTYLDYHASAIQTLILGNSHAYYGINPTFLTASSFNAANVSQSLYYDLLILKKYEAKLTHLSRIIIPIDYFTLFKNMEEGGESWRVKNYNLYYDMNESKDFANHTEILSGKLRVNLLRLNSYYVSKVIGTTSDKLGWGDKYKHESVPMLKESAGLAVGRHTVKDYHLLKENISILTSMIEIAKSKNIKVILITSPVHKYYYTQVNPAQIARTISEATKLRDKFDITYVNLFRDPSFKDTDFYDGDHMNELGAKKLTLKIDSVVTHLNTLRALEK
jgi:hypothetical protein